VEPKWKKVTSAFSLVELVASNWAFLMLEVGVEDFQSLGGVNV